MCLWVDQRRTRVMRDGGKNRVREVHINQIEEAL